MSSRSQQPGQPGEIVGGNRQDESGLHRFEAAIDGLGHAADGLGPAEGLLDPFAVSLGLGVAVMLGGTAVAPARLRKKQGEEAVARIDAIFDIERACCHLTLSFGVADGVGDIAHAFCLQIDARADGVRELADWTDG